jgi:beta-fructofuranosidase
MKVVLQIVLFVICISAVYAQTGEDLQRSRKNLSSDKYRPLYHLSSPGVRLHDPGGICWWKGKYHLFYIAAGGKGHAVSDDMVTWTDLPVIENLSGSTGQIVVTEEQVMMSYAREGVFLATASDSLLLNWECNLILDSTQLKSFQGPIDTDFWYEDSSWCLVCRKHNWEKGLYHFEGGRPALGLFQSDNLQDWEYKGIFYEKKNSIEPGDDLACPNFLPIGKKRHLLLFYCHRRGPMYVTGLYDKEKKKFNAEYYGQMSFGPTKRGSLHAPSAFIDPGNRCISVFNVTENPFVKKDWMGVMSLPRQLSLQKGYFDPINRDQNMVQENLRNYFNPLRIEPLGELKSLRFNHIQLSNVIIPGNTEKIIEGIQGKSMEMEVLINPKKSRELGLNVFRSPNGEEQTTIRVYIHGDGRTENVCHLSIDVSGSTIDPEAHSRSPETGPLYLEPDELIKLRVFIDQSIVEVFANDRQCLTIRAYPDRQDSKLVSVYSKGSEAELISLRAWQMRSIWPELKQKEGK